MISWISLNPMVNKEVSSDKPAEKPSQKRLAVGEFSPQGSMVVFTEKLANRVFAESAIRHTVAI